MKFHNEPLIIVRRHWLCGQGTCQGEMQKHGTKGSVDSTGVVKWAHQCSACGRLEYGPVHPRLVYLDVNGDAVDV